MRSFLAAAALLQSFVQLTTAQSTISNETSSACPQQGGVHMIVARASLEAEGYGIIGAVKDAVLAQVPGSTAEFVVYEATLNLYTQSESDGVVAARVLIDAYINNCPGLPLVVMGYSQGAQVTADSLVGQDVKNFPVNSTLQDPLPESTLSRVAAVIMMGDPSFVTQETFHVGNATKDAVFPRLNVDNFNTADLGSRTQSYCNAGDQYCASGNSIIIHLQYVKEYGVNATEFIKNNVASWYSANGGAASNSTGSGSSSILQPKPSASSSTASRSVPTASASSSNEAASSSASNAASPTASSTTPVSTGAAASLEVVGTSLGALVAGLLAFFL